MSPARTVAGDADDGPGPAGPIPLSGYQLTGGEQQPRPPEGLLVVPAQAGKGERGRHADSPRDGNGEPRSPGVPVADERRGDEIEPEDEFQRVAEVDRREASATTADTATGLGVEQRLPLEIQRTPDGKSTVGECPTRQRRGQHHRDAVAAPGPLGLPVGPCQPERKDGERGHGDDRSDPVPIPGREGGREEEREKGREEGVWRHGYFSMTVNSRSANSTA